MLKEFKISKIGLKFLIPYIVLYSIYIQLHGEVSPGGGFQAGVIFATALIGYDLILGGDKLQEKFSIKHLTVLGVLGVLIYALTGIISLIYDDNYLNYSAILEDNIRGQHIGIFLIELGVGLTVSAIMCLIYLLLRED